VQPAAAQPIAIMGRGRIVAERERQNWGREGRDRTVAERGEARLW